MNKQLSTQSEITKALGISRTTLFRLVSEGLPHSETPNGKKLFDEDEVRQFILDRKNNIAKELVVGNDYTNYDIVRIFNVGNMGGMRRSHSKNALVLISFQDGSSGLYNDYWKNDILFYTGQGMAGEQKLEGQNKTLAESNQNGITVYLFEMFYQQRYQYRGIVKLVGEPFPEIEYDVNGKERKVWKFPLKLINEKDIMDVTIIDEQESHLHGTISIAEYLENWENFKKAQSIKFEATERTVKTTRVQTTPVIGEYVKMRAGRFCELCGCEAPFEYNGRPYLELHHLKSISEGGKDSTDNVAAICPNCHKKLDMLKDPRDIELLRAKMAQNDAALQKQLRGEG